MELTVELDHTCDHCGKTSPATVVGHGAVVGDAYARLEGGAGESPIADAEVAAQEEAAALIRLAVCPACGRRNPAVVARLVALAAAQVVGALLLAVGSWVLVQIGALQEREGRIALSLLVLAALALLVIGVVRVPARLRASVERVHFRR